MDEKRSCGHSWLVAGLIAAVASSAAGQQVRDLTSGDPTKEQLIEILKPKADLDPLGGARGIGIKQRRQCNLEKPGGSRGVNIKAISDVAAVRIRFAYDSADILPEAKASLDALGGALVSSDLASSCFRIRGHTDSKGSASYNARLSRQRAEAVVRYLTEHFGIEPDRLDAVGLGESTPFAGNETEEGRSRNRRVEIANVGS